ncbi:MAG: L-histidine N(alpha)-methyltransferase [Flavobacteriales bacterium]|nr:L-histidine N(alpha)-methyltransferase [Flavobacteriales bacterium]
MPHFAQDVREGLNASPKRLSSKYFYDDEGSRIFQEIMAMPEYYLTNSEMEILHEQSLDMLKSTDLSGSFNVIELGAGDGTKTQLMLKAFLDAGHSPVYHPVDISQEAVDIVSKRLHQELPGLQIRPEVGDYFHMMSEVTAQETPCLILFLGSNIGNYIPPKNIELLALIKENMSSGDYFLLGVDLKKETKLIKAAYDDPHGITKRFNLNILTRINRELGADFNLDDWDFVCRYNSENGEVRSYLKSVKEQKVKISAIEKEYNFLAGEEIWTELSKKYELEEIREAGERAGLTFVQHFTDRQHHFTDTLFKKL